MNKRKQSSEDRLRRLNEGRCPIHGIGMSQVDRWFYPRDSEAFTIVGCPRKDCNIEARAFGIDGPWDLITTGDRTVLNEKEWIFV